MTLQPDLQQGCRLACVPPQQLLSSFVHHADVTQALGISDPAVSPSTWPTIADSK